MERFVTGQRTEQKQLLSVQPVKDFSMIPSKAQGPLQKTVHQEGKNPSLRKSAGSAVYPWTWQLHSSTHSSCGYLHTTEHVSSPPWTGDELMKHHQQAEELLAVNSCSGRRSLFFRISTSKLPMLQEITTHPRSGNPS